MALGLARVAIVYGTALAGPRFGFQATALPHRNLFARMLEHPGAKGMSGNVGEAIPTYRQSGVAFRRAVALLQGAPAASLVAHHPVYLRLSGGQGQRVAAARMFVREPELLVCDEFSSALDSETERLLWRRILDLGATCLIVSPRRAALEHADQILVLEEGRIAARGTLASLQLHEIWQELAPMLGLVSNRKRGQAMVTVIDIVSVCPVSVPYPPSVGTN